MAENAEGQTPSTEDLYDWATSAAGVDGGNHPVVADSGWGVDNRFEADGGIPTLTLLGPGAEVLIADGYVTGADIEAALP